MDELIHLMRDFDHQKILSLLLLCDLIVHEVHSMLSFPLPRHLRILLHFSSSITVYHRNVKTAKTRPPSSNLRSSFTVLSTARLSLEPLRFCAVFEIFVLPFYSNYFLQIEEFRKRLLWMFMRFDSSSSKLFPYIFLERGFCFDTSSCLGTI